VRQARSELPDSAYFCQEVALAAIDVVGATPSTLKRFRLVSIPVSRAGSPVRSSARLMSGCHQAAASANTLVSAR
jgi:hypothetical protein